MADKSDLLLDALRVIASGNRPQPASIARRAIALHELQSIDWKIGETDGPSGSNYYTAGLDYAEPSGVASDGWHHHAIQFNSKDKDQAEAWRDLVFSTMLTLTAPELRPWRDELEEIVGHLGTSITQSVDSDDQIIMGHVRSAHEIAKILLRKTRDGK